MTQDPNIDPEMERFEADLLESVRQALRGKYASVRPIQPTLAPTRKRRRDAGPRVAINMMVPETVAAPFVAFCHENRYTYWEGVQELMKRATSTAQSTVADSPSNPATGARAARRHRTGRNQQINIKATPEVIARFYALVDANGLSVAENFEKAVDAVTATAAKE